MKKEKKSLENTKQKTKSKSIAEAFKNVPRYEPTEDDKGKMVMLEMFKRNNGEISSYFLAEKVIGEEYNRGKLTLVIREIGDQPPHRQEKLIAAVMAYYIGWEKTVPFYNAMVKTPEKEPDPQFVMEFINDLPDQIMNLQSKYILKNALKISFLSMLYII